MALDQMTEHEKLSLVHGVIAAPWGEQPRPPGSIGSAGYVSGVPRLGIPPLQETDAELGIANPGDVRPGDTATAMPSNLALASTWNPEVARLQGDLNSTEGKLADLKRRQLQSNVVGNVAGSGARDPLAGTDMRCPNRRTSAGVS